MSNHATAILEMIDEKVNDGDVFTAYDITSAVRSKLQDNVRHNDVRKIVDDSFTGGNMIGYARELCVLDLSNGPQANVYFPDTASANDHPLVSTATGNVATADPIVTDDDDDITDDDDDDLVDDGVTNTDTFDVTKEGRVNIPKKILGAVSPASGSYDILVSGSLKCVTPNKDGRVRVNVKTLGISSPKVNISVDTSTNTIEVVTA